MTLTLDQHVVPEPETVPPQLDRPDRVLAIIIDPEDVDLVLPVALAAAVEDLLELHVAVLGPRSPRGEDGDRVDRWCGELVRWVRAVTADAGVDAPVSVHLLHELRASRRPHVLARVVHWLARRSDAQPLGRWAA
ncbi:hypothetical protein [Trujillonella humicola]|uniref:hypothetical protein n=1 Tax=Trujillonella humicola TaxID=3383699 RepID=UPI003906091F